MTRIELERTPFQVIRYRWSVPYDDCSGLAGWAATKWGARRAAKKAVADWGDPT